MGGYKIQLKDKNGNRQYPVSTIDVVVDADGVSVADLLDRKQPTLVSGVNIKTINGKTLLGEGDLVIEGGTADLSGYATTEYVDAKVGESYPVHLPINGIALTDEQIAVNKEAYDAFQRATQEEGLPLFYMADMNASYYLIVAQGSDENGVLDNLYLSRDIYIYSTDAEIWEMTIEGELQPDGSITNFEMHDRGTYTTTYLDNRFSQISGGGGSGETAESDVICVVWDDDTSDIPSNKEAYQKLAESINTVGKPAAVMVCVETGYRWGIAKYYWKSNVGGDIELTTPVTESGLYCVFTLTSEGVCTASYKQADLGGLKYFVERYVYAGDTEEERTYNLESLAMAEQGVDILWAGLESIGLSRYIAAGAWYWRFEQGMFVSMFEAYIDTDGTFVFQPRNFCRVFMPTTNTEMKEYMKAFFKEENWPYEQAYYGVFPIISWSDETETSVKAYFLSNGLAIAHAVIDTETGEVGQAAVGQ